jgi:hypothetical protein
LNDVTRMNTVYASYFTDKPPARATLSAVRQDSRNEGSSA